MLLKNKETMKYKFKYAMIFSLHIDNSKLAQKYYKTNHDWVGKVNLSKKMKPIKFSRISRYKRIT